MPTRGNGYSAPLLLIIVLALVSLPVYYWFNSYYASSYNNVKGATSVNGSTITPGLSISVSSNAETWDLVEYLCNTKEECVSSLTSGRRLGTVSGGKTDGHEIMVSYSPEWDSYNYIKFFVRSGWYSKDGEFTVSSLGDISGTTTHTLSDGNYSYEVVIVPTDKIKSNFLNSASFSDK